MSAKAGRSLSISLAECGGVGDDSTSNDTALALAFTRLAAAGGGELRVPLGTFRYSTVNKTIDNITISGEGSGSILKTTQTPSASQQNAFRLIGSNLTLRGLHFTQANPIATRRGRVYTSNGDHIRIGGASSSTWTENILVEGCIVDGGYTAGLDLYYANHVVARNNIVKNAFGNGLCAINCQNDVLLDGNFVYNTTDDLMIVNTDTSVPTGTLRVVITNNTVKDGDAKGIATTGVDKCLIKGNHVKNTHTFGIAVFQDSFYALGNSTNVVVEGNTIEDAGQAYGADWLVDTISTVPNAMRCDGTNIKVQGNIILNPAGRGIDSTRSTRLSIQNNTIKQCAQTGIEIGDPSDSDYTRIVDCEITGNTIQQTVGGLTIGSATGVIVHSNLVRTFKNGGGAGRRGIFYGYIKKAIISGNVVINDDAADATILQYAGHACPDTTVINNSELDATDITADATGAINLNGIKILTGTGSPEGVVAAPKGSIFLRSDGDFQTSVYLKMAFGGGNTGWRPPAQVAQLGDTSAITVSADLDTAWKALTSTSVTPPDGAMGFDNTNHLFWVRMAGKWNKSSAFTVLS